MPESKEKGRRPMRLALRAHESLPALPRWCSCGHRAETIYQRETHLIEVLTESVADDIRAQALGDAADAASDLLSTPDGQVGEIRAWTNWLRARAEEVGK